MVTDFSTSSHLTFDSEKWLKDEKDVCGCAGGGIAVSAIWKQYKVPSICHDLRGFLWDLMQQEPDRRKQWLTQNYSIWFRWDSDKIPLKWPYLYEWGMEVNQDGKMAPRGILLTTVLPKCLEAAAWEMCSPALSLQTALARTIPWSIEKAVCCPWNHCQVHWNNNSVYSWPPCTSTNADGRPSQPLTL